MATVTLDITEFREQFPAFASETTYPDATITRAFEMSELYISNNTNDILTESKLQLSLFLLMAHLLTLESNALSGGTNGTVTSASIDKISVTLLAPTSTSKFSFFMNQTTYGQQLLALWQLLIKGGFYIGGNPETRAFKKVGGRY